MRFILSCSVLSRRTDGFRPFVFRPVFSSSTPTFLPLSPRRPPFPHHFPHSQQTAELEHETFQLKQSAAIAAEVKSVLDSHVRHEAQLREQEQIDLVQTVLANVQKQLGDKKLQRDILLSSVAEVESESLPPFSGSSSSEYGRSRCEKGARWCTKY